VKVVASATAILRSLFNSGEKETYTIVEKEVTRKKLPRYIMKKRHIVISVPMFKIEV
jgi:hypothetical protein